MKVMKTIFWIIINILIWFLIISQIGTVWKFFGGTFINGNEIVYKGKVLATAHDDCMLSWTEGLTKVEMFCPKTGTKDTWIDGKHQTNAVEK